MLILVLTALKSSTDNSVVVLTITQGQFAEPLPYAGC